MTIPKCDHIITLFSISINCSFQLININCNGLTFYLNPLDETLHLPFRYYRMIKLSPHYLLHFFLFYALNVSYSTAKSSAEFSLVFSFTTENCGHFERFFSHETRFRIRWMRIRTVKDAKLERHMNAGWKRTNVVCIGEITY